MSISRTGRGCRPCSSADLAAVPSFGRTPLAARLLVEADLDRPDGPGAVSRRRLEPTTPPPSWNVVCDRGRKFGVVDDE